MKANMDDYFHSLQMCPVVSISNKRVFMTLSISIAMSGIPLWRSLLKSYLTPWPIHSRLFCCNIGIFLSRVKGCKNHPLLGSSETISPIMVVSSSLSALPLFKVLTVHQTHLMAEWEMPCCRYAGRRQRRRSGRRETRLSVASHQSPGSHSLLSYAPALPWKQYGGGIYWTVGVPLTPTQALWLEVFPTLIV